MSTTYNLVLESLKATVAVLYYCCWCLWDLFFICFLGLNLTSPPRCFCLYQFINLHHFWNLAAMSLKVNKFICAFATRWWINLALSDFAGVSWILCFNWTMVLLSYPASSDFPVTQVRSSRLNKYIFDSSILEW